MARFSATHRAVATTYPGRKTNPYNGDHHTMRYGLDVPIRRAARWDGVCLKSYHQQQRQPLTPADFRACLTYIHEQRATDAPFDVIISGDTFDMGQHGASDLVRPFAAAGATWWVEEGLGYTVDEFRARIRFGPPRAE